MESHPRISELLVETGAYSDLENPVILTSGELGIYYVNAEKLCQDSGKFKEHGKSASNMFKHAVDMMKEHKTFKEAIKIISDKVESLFPEDIDKQYRAVSGGQRRDWLFSGPVAAKLGIQHVSLYKDSSLEVLDPKGDLVSRNIKNLYVVHIVDLITEGSSVYRVESGRAHGWVPWLREAGAHIKDMVAVVTRLQGGEATLSEQDVNVHSFVAIDKDFVNKHSKEPERALSYMKNPSKWCSNFLKQNGALHLVDTFDPAANKLDRAREFVTRYEKVLEQYGHLKKLESAVKKKFSITLKEV